MPKDTTEIKGPCAATPSISCAKRRLPFSSGEKRAVPNGRLTSASRATLATPQPVQAESRSGRLFDSLEANHLVNSSFDSERDVLNSSRASVVSQHTAEKRAAAKSWMSQAFEAGDGFIYSEAIYAQYRKYIRDPQLLLPADMRNGFFAFFKQCFPFAIPRKKQKVGVRKCCYFGIRWKTGVDSGSVSSHVATAQAESRTSDADDSVSTLSPSDDGFARSTPFHNDASVQVQSPEEPILATADDSVSTCPPSEATFLSSSPRPDSEFNFLEPPPIDFMRFHLKFPIPREVIEQSKALLPYSLKPMYEQTPSERRAVAEARAEFRERKCITCGEAFTNKFSLRQHQQDTFDCSGYGLDCRLCKKKHRSKNELKLHILSCNGQREPSSGDIEDDLRDHASLASVALSFPSVSDPHPPFRPTEQMKRLFSDNLDSDKRAAIKRLHSERLFSEQLDLSTSSSSMRRFIPRPPQLPGEEREDEAEHTKPPRAKLIKLSKQQASCYPNRSHSSEFDVPRLGNIAQCPQINVSDYVNKYVSSVRPFTPQPLICLSKGKKQKPASAVCSKTLGRHATTPEVLAHFYRE